MSNPREYQTEAVIIRKTRLGEADLIITFFTPGMGKLQGFARSVRKTRSKLSGHLELLTHSQVTLIRGKNLDTIIGSQSINSFMPLRKCLESTSCGLYLAEMVNLFTAEADRIDNQQLFQLLTDTLEFISQGSNASICLRYFEIQLLNLTGYRPQLKVCTVCREALQPVVNIFSPGAGGMLCAKCSLNRNLPYKISVNGLKVMRLLQDCSFATALRLKLEADLNTEIERLVRNYCLFILEREIRSCKWLDVLKQPPGVIQLY